MDLTIRPLAGAERSCAWRSGGRSTGLSLRRGSKVIASRSGRATRSRTSRWWRLWRGPSIDSGARRERGLDLRAAGPGPGTLLTFLLTFGDHTPKNSASGPGGLWP